MPPKSRVLGAVVRRSQSITSLGWYRKRCAIASQWAQHCSRILFGWSRRRFRLPRRDVNLATVQIQNSDYILIIPIRRNPKQLSSAPQFVCSQIIAICTMKAAFALALLLETAKAFTVQGGIRQKRTQLGVAEPLLFGKRAAAQ